jgi:hypothetical protein
MMPPGGPGAMPGGGMMLPPAAGMGMPGFSAAPGSSGAMPTAMRLPEPADVQVMQYRAAAGSSVTPAALAGQSSLSK